MDGKIEPQPTPGGTKVYPHQQSPYRMANERVSDVSDRNLYGQVPNYFALPIQLYLEFDHKNESSTIRIAHREQDKQMTFDCRPNKILYVKLRWKVFVARYGYGDGGYARVVMMMEVMICVRLELLFPYIHLICTYFNHLEYGYGS